MNNDLAEQLDGRLQRPQPSRAARQSAPELSYGRHFGPAPVSARPAAVLLLLYPHAGQWHLPLIVRSAQLANHAGQICPPGGLVEAGETSAEAAVRELAEELGTDLPVRMVGRLCNLYIFSTDYLVTPWVGIGQIRPDWRPNPAEVAEVLEIPIADLLADDCRGRFVMTEGCVSFAAPCFGWRGHRIWGATSMMLAELLSLLDDVGV